MADKAELRHEQNLLAEYTRREGCDYKKLTQQKARGKGGVGEGYEKSMTRHGDKTFYRFQKRISLCSQQILRYSWNGTPLFITKPTKDNVPPCPFCGASRVFELQLLPSIINFLKPDHGSDEAMEFGTVLVYTCPAACWGEGETHREESIIVQADPDLDVLRSKAEKQDRTDSKVS